LGSGSSIVPFVPPIRAKRTDAVRNRERVVAAAEVLLAERGIDATIPDIAAAAGVGKATVYRSFPTKEHLVAAIAGRHLRRLAASCDEAATSDDPARALAAILRDVARRQATNRLLTGALSAAVRLPDFVQEREEVLAAIQRLIDAGRAQGALREDAVADDVRILFTGASSVLIEREESDPAVWERYADLLVAALRP
jgi:AcrR family transcriptional regulator